MRDAVTYFACPDCPAAYGEGRYLRWLRRYFRFVEYLPLMVKDNTSGANEAGFSVSFYNKGQEADGRMEELRNIRISVRNLVEFILRSGDIDQHKGGFADRDAMLEGGRIHRKIQGRMGGSYQAEAPLSVQIPCGDYILTVEGRADGIFREEVQPEQMIAQRALEQFSGPACVRTSEQTHDPGAPNNQTPANEAADQNADMSRPIPEESERNSAALRHSTGPDGREAAVLCPFIDEIKGVYRDVTAMDAPVPVHLAQAKCYAYIYASREGFSFIGVQMTYCSLDTEAIHRFREYYSTTDLTGWFRNLIENYQKWIKMQLDWELVRQASIRPLAFPYPWRTGQKDVAASVYRTILRRKKLFLQAPTGTGKTLATLYPAVKAMGEGLAERIFYTTAKTITRTVAEESFALLRASGLRMKTITLTAKEKICFTGEAECNPAACPYAKGHFDRVNDAVFELLSSGEALTRETLEKQAQKWMVCPFEMGLDAAVWADAVICDYNYVFDPHAKLKRFFQDGAKGEYIFLIDEAHNLVERAREMFSASLYKEDFLALKREAAPHSKKLSRALNRCNRYLLDKKRELEGESLQGDTAGGTAALSRAKPDAGNVMPQKAPAGAAAALSRAKPGSGYAMPQKAPAGGTAALPRIKPGSGNVKIQKDTGTFPVYLMNLCGVMEEFLEDSRNAELNQKVLELYFQVRTFLDTCDRLNQNYVVYTELCGDGRFLMRLLCVDVSENLQQCLNTGRSTIYFSATFLPIRYYKSLLSTDREDYAIYAKPTFDPANRLVLIGTDTSSRYRNRTPETYRRIAEYVLELIRAKRGNYMVFFSSYQMMSQAREQFLGLAKQEGETIECVCQEPGMTEPEREAFLGLFESPHERGLAGFCVMGGIFGEGIDLKKDRLIGAVLVGIGLPQVCTEREILKGFYDRRGEDGFFYAYLCPGMNKVLQSAGRVIRTEEDEGVILLLDERFASARCRSMFPVEWAQPEYCTIASVREKAERFWARRE